MSYPHITWAKYCGWLNFRGVPIFVVFVESPIHEFQYPRIGNFLHELWRKILWPRILNPTNVSILFNLRKLVPTKIKPSTVWPWTSNSGPQFKIRMTAPYPYSSSSSSYSSYLSNMLVRLKLTITLPWNKMSKSSGLNIDVCKTLMPPFPNI